MQPTHKFLSGFLLNNDSCESMKAYVNIQIPFFVAIIGLSISVPLFGYLIHESSHALGCIIFNIPFNYSLSYVTPLVDVSRTPFVIIGLMGGFGEALGSLLTFCMAIYFEKRSAKWFLAMTGLEVAFLTMVIMGIINSVMEGLFYQIYQNIFNNAATLLLLFSLAILAATSIVIGWKYKKINALRVAKII